jgi:hypothetical protein
VPSQAGPRFFAFLDKVDILEGLNKPHRRYNSKHDLRLMAKLVGTCNSWSLSYDSMQVSYYISLDRFAVAGYYKW